MKKIILFLIAFVSLFLVNNKEADASKKSSYENMLDMSMLRIDESTGFFCSDQQIEIVEGVTYTVVASKSFFGTRISQHSELSGRFFLASYDTNSGTNASLGFGFEVESTGLHHTTLTSPISCTMTIKNFLSQGFTLETFKRDEVVMFEGDMSKFDGFKKYSDLNGYEKADSSIEIYTNVDNKISINTITNNIAAYDNQDGIIEDVSIHSDNYSESTTIGTYQVVYKATDASDNTSYLTVNVKVVDKTVPNLTGPQDIYWELGDPCPTKAQIVSYFTAVDNVDGDISSQITLASSGLGGYNPNKEAKYILVLKVKDSSGNETSKNAYLVVRDTVAPEVTVQDVSFNLSESFTTMENLAQKVYVKATDASGSKNVSYDYGEYLDEYGFAGKYEITITVTDNSGNATVKKAYITIVDDIAPDFYLKTSLLTTDESTVYSMKDVKNAIKKKLNDDGILYDEIQMISCDYFKNEKTPGEYQAKFLYTYDGHVNYMVGTIIVEEPPVTNYTFLIIGIIIAIVLILVVAVGKKKRSMV